MKRILQFQVPPLYVEGTQKSNPFSGDAETPVIAPHSKTCECGRPIALVKNHTHSPIDGSCRCGFASCLAFTEDPEMLYELFRRGMALNWEVLLAESA